MTEAADLFDISFGLAGRSIPEEHGYALYSALCHEIPPLHTAEWLAIHPIRGHRQVGGRLGIAEFSAITLRMPLDKLAVVAPLVGRSLELNGHSVRVRPPTVFPLVPSASLDARVVTIKLTSIPRSKDGSIDKSDAEGRFRAELQRQLARIRVTATPSLRGKRETVVDGHRVLGWSVRLSNLTPEASLALQHHGLGGKRRMGCGVFVPTRAR